jgi:competence protein ComEA
LDRFGEWRLIEPSTADEPEKSAQPPPGPAAPAAGKPADGKGADGKSTVRLAALLGALVLAVTGVAIWITSPQPNVAFDVSGNAAFADLRTPGPLAAPSVTAGAIGTVVVDVEGAVVTPGLHRLAEGSRVGDAIAAAGGYGPWVDIAAAAAQLNLAEPLTDGAKVRVPALGDASTIEGSLTPPPADSGNGDQAPTGGPINVNTASSDELDTLPGIGPVTAAKIIAAREEAQFASVDELLSRQILGPSTFEKLRDLVSVGP